MKCSWVFLTGQLLATVLTLPAQAAEWTPRVQAVGDSKANYLNVEITADSRYLVWFEAHQGSASQGDVWHCAIDQKTGALLPADCRGFRAFKSTAWGRANPGYDTRGPYYIGADPDGRLIMVRPTGATTGEITHLPTAADPRRRAIYPSNLKDHKTGYLLFIQNDNSPGAGVRPRNTWVELQYLDLAHPERVHVIERQEIPAHGFAPMDSGFVRWMRERSLITYGYPLEQPGKMGIRTFDVTQPQRGAVALFKDGTNRIDPYAAVIGSYDYLLAGINGTATSHIYRRAAGLSSDAAFTLWKEIAPHGSQLQNPWLAQSHEPFIFRGRLYSVYQVNEKGRGFFDTTFKNPGEIWLADLSADPVQQWRIAPGDGGPVSEPEPLVTTDCVWIFYNRSMIEAASSTPPATENSSVAGKTFRERLIERRKSAGGMPRLALYRAVVPMCEVSE